MLMDSDGLAVSCLVLNSTTGNTQFFLLQGPKKKKKNFSPETALMAFHGN